MDMRTADRIRDAQASALDLTQYGFGYVVAEQRVVWFRGTPERAEAKARRWGSRAPGRDWVGSDL
jgi:hypothetical protein